MTEDQWTAVDRYIADLFVPPDPVLEEVLRASDAGGLPQFQVSPTQGMLLQLLAQAVRARSILEIGTLGGYSTIWLARALPPDGQLITLEANMAYAKVAQANIARAGLDDRVEVRLGRGVESMDRLVAEGHPPFDLIFIDADKLSYSAYFQWSLRLSRPGTLIIADNVIRDGEIINADSHDPSVQGARRFNERVAAEPRVTATAIQTVGNKGYDGFALILVGDE
jgi:predicted O-methyltransferase YrrM